MKLAATSDEIAWRIARTKFSGSHDEMFSGEGAAKSDVGRWNSEGKRVVHASDSLALAVLEVVVRLKKTDLMEDYSCCKLAIPYRLCEKVSAKDLPVGWDALAVAPEDGGYPCDSGAHFQKGIWYLYSWTSCV